RDPGEPVAPVRPEGGAGWLVEAYEVSGVPGVVARRVSGDREAVAAVRSHAVGGRRTGHQGQVPLDLIPAGDVRLGKLVDRPRLAVELVRGLPRALYVLDGRRELVPELRPHSAAGVPLKAVVCRRRAHVELLDRYEALAPQVLDDAAEAGFRRDRLDQRDGDRERHRGRQPERLRRRQHPLVTQPDHRQPQRGEAHARTIFSHASSYKGGRSLVP